MTSTKTNKRRSAKRQNPFWMVVSAAMSLTVAMPAQANATGFSSIGFNGCSKADRSGAAIDPRSHTASTLRYDRSEAALSVVQYQALSGNNAAINPQIRPHVNCSKKSNLYVKIAPPYADTPSSSFASDWDLYLVAASAAYGGITTDTIGLQVQKNTGSQEILKFSAAWIQLDGVELVAFSGVAQFDRRVDLFADVQYSVDGALVDARAGGRIGW